jgi:hypothetical protein
MTQTHTAKRILALAVLAVSAASCGDVARSSQSPVYLVLDSLEARRGNATVANNVLLSDVITNVTSPAPCSAASPCPTVFNDMGAAVFSIALKDITNPSLTEPTSNNSVTLTRYRVTYRRADGRHTPGVDVPYPFDGAATITVPATNAMSFEIVRHAAKEESPLVQLRDNPNVITTIADVTFYGQDRVGNDVSVTGSIQIDFGNFVDQ